METTFHLNDIVTIKGQEGLFTIIAFITQDVVSCLSNKTNANLIIDKSLIRLSKLSTNNQG